LQSIRCKKFILLSGYVVNKAEKMKFFFEKGIEQFL